ncbi:MAG: alpha/beta fold hydrolase [Mucilaginibacter sp.]
MRLIFKVLLWLLGLTMAIYMVVCAYFYFAQDRIIFPAEKLTGDYRFDFPYPFKEYTIKTSTGTLSGLLFKADKPKGLIFYLHGNGSELDTWGGIAPAYTSLNYDMFILDYPGYGKSTGQLTNEKEMLDAIQTAYDTVKAGYSENNIIIMAHSIGTGPAAWLASQKHPRKLVLLAPYYSIADMIDQRYPFLPHFFCKYRFTTYKYIRGVKAPVIIFHGDDDRVINYEASLKLKKHFKRGDRLIILNGQGHDNIQDNEDYIRELKAILE